MSTLFKAIGGKPTVPILEEFNSFMRGFKGDAKAEIEKLINSGQISQQELNVAQQKARELSKLMGW